MKLVKGVWLPDLDTAFSSPAHYQQEKRNKGLEYVKHGNRRTFVDIGAHCGTWSMHLTKLFTKTVAFEPVAAHCECFRKNVQGDYVLHQIALGDREGLVSMNVGVENSGHTTVAGEGTIIMRRLDDFDLQDADYMKIDCEGYELHVLRGAEETLKRCKPAIIVEQKPGLALKFGLPDTGAVDYLKSLGATLRDTMHGDYILSW